MPTNPHHQQSFGTFEGISSADQLRLYFQLTDFDRALIDEMRSATTKLGFAVQLSSVRFLGTFPTNLQQVPAEVIDYLVLVQIFLADLILIYWVPRNEGLRA